jgi:hypothetical protein
MSFQCNEHICVLILSSASINLSIPCIKTDLHTSRVLELSTGISPVTRLLAWLGYQELVGEKRMHLPGD